MESIARDGQDIKVLVDINFENVAAVRRCGEQLIKMHESPNVIVNFTEVAHSDAAGLALLTAWTKSAKQFGKKIQFNNLPESLQRMLKLCDVEQELPVQLNDSYIKDKVT